MRNDKQEITAEKITINLKTGDVFAEKQVKSRMLTQNAKGQQTEARVESHLQEIDSETGTLLANGKAVVQYEDMVAKGPKAVFYMEQQALDRIVLNGRAEVEDPDQRVVGDSITITLNPKQFKAQGNVQSFIKAKEKQKAASSAGGAAKPAITAKQTQASAEKELMLEEME